VTGIDKSAPAPGDSCPALEESAAELVAELAARGARVAVAESLTGGLVTAQLTGIPGASRVLNGGIVAYNTTVKTTLLGVSAELLARCGAVNTDVARQMAVGVCRALAVSGRPSELGISTTGVAGPAPQDGVNPGVVFLGIAWRGGVRAIPLSLSGDRAEIRTAATAAAITEALRAVRMPVTR